MSKSAKISREPLASRVLSQLPHSLWRSVSNPSLLITYYHMVSDEGVPHVKHLYQYRNVSLFREDIDFFLANYNPVSLSDVIRHLNGGPPLRKPSLLLTFDDGFREMHDIVAPILKAKGFPAVFFLTTGFLNNADMAHHCKLSVLVDHFEKRPDSKAMKAAQALLTSNSVPGDSFPAQMVAVRYVQRHLVDEIASLCGYDLKGYISSAKPYLSSEQVKSLLAQGFDIGGHSVDHPLYADIPLKEQVRQTTESLDFLVSHFQIPSRSFAFPHSDVGVSKEFYDTLYGANKLQVSFGTRGMVKHFCPWNLERFTMETTLAPASRILKKNYIRRVYRTLVRAGSRA